MAYHVDRNSQAVFCRAFHHCPFGALKRHYPTVKDAELALESRRSGEALAYLTLNIVAFEVRYSLASIGMPVTSELARQQLARYDKHTQEQIWRVVQAQEQRYRKS